MPFFPYERALLTVPTEELPTVFGVGPRWPTVDMDAPDIRTEQQRAAEIAIQSPPPEEETQQAPDQWQPPLTAADFAHVLELLRKKWNM